MTSQEEQRNIHGAIVAMENAMLEIMALRDKAQAAKDMTLFNVYNVVWHKLNAAVDEHIENLRKFD